MNKIWLPDTGNDSESDLSADDQFETQPVAIKDGYAYVNTGVKIELQYIGIGLFGEVILIPRRGS